VKYQRKHLHGIKTGISQSTYNPGEAAMSDKQFKRGKKLLGTVGGKSGIESIKSITKISPMHGRAIIEYCYGTVWSEPHLSIKTKLLILISVCASQGEYEAVSRQVRGAINHGAKPKEIIEAITTCAPYIGYPRTNKSLRTAQKTIDDFGKHPEWKAIRYPA
jgi:alkylhydroperoxidase/carboxymuconolactone decarboxylase family protein YurZ